MSSSSETPTNPSALASGEEAFIGSTATAMFEGEASDQRSAARADGASQGPATKPAGASSPDGTVAWFPVAPTSSVGRYDPVEFLDRGGMGEVWVVRDREIGRDVALKRARATKQSDAQERLLAEAQITGQLEHPNIVPVHDLGIDGEGNPYYVMTFLRGKEFKKLLDDFHDSPAGKSDSPLERLRFLEIFAQACRAVAYAHRRGVVHRDIKPDNIMVGPFGETMVIDWGLAKLLDFDDGRTSGYERLSGIRGSNETQKERPAGTPGYMAPEQADFRSEGIDERTDVYLLGATLFEILTGQPPRRGSSADEMRELARSVPVVSPREINKLAPKPLAAICLKAMSRRKQDRYESVEALADDVQRYIAGEPVSAFPEGLATRVWRKAKRHRHRLARMAGALAIVLLAVLAAALWNRSRTLAQREAARETLVEFRETAQRAMAEIGVDAPGETALYFDAARGTNRGREALAAIDGWGGQLEAFPLTDEREQVKGELRELLLNLALFESHTATSSDRATYSRLWLQRAEALGEPTQTWRRVSARLYSLEGDAPSAERELQLAADPKTPRTALDEFLDAERLRLIAAQSSYATEVEAVYDPFEDDPVFRSTDSAAPAGKARRDALQSAIAGYRRALEANPRHYWSHYQLGRCLLSIGQIDDAIAALGACIAIDPKNPWAFSSRALALARGKRFDEALRDCEAALAIDPAFAPAKLQRGVTLMLAGKSTEALADFTAVLDLPAEERLVEAAWYRGLLSMQEETKYEQALADFALVAKERPRLREAFLKRAEIHLAKGESDTALAEIDAWLGKSGKAIDFARRQQRARALRKLPKSSAIAARIQVAALKLALDELLAARDELPDDGARAAEYFDELGRVYYSLGMGKEALAAWNDGIAIAPPNAAALRAKLLDKRGWHFATRAKRDKLDEALADFRAALPADTELAAQIPWSLRADLHAGIGYVSALKGDVATAREQAIEVGALSVENRQDHDALHHNVACIYAALSEIGAEGENYDLALTHLQTGVRLGGDKARALLKSDLQSFPEKLKQMPQFKRLLPPLTETQ